MIADFTQDEKALLLKIARESIFEYLQSGELRKYNEKSMPPALLQKAGAFVSIHLKNNLRGCMGTFNSELQLLLNVQKMAVNSATRDPRFDALRLAELPEVVIEVSVISPLQKIDSIDEFNPDLHGIYLKKDGRTGTFLPQVAKQTRWTKEELLGHCARDKAGLGWEGWKEAEWFVYTAKIFSE